MAKRHKETNRATILDRVTTPLAFFTLGILVIEAILASLSLRASGANLTILILGMLTGFLLLCVMVFVLTVHPRLRQALMGVADPSPAASINEMQLTPSDMLVLSASINTHSDVMTVMREVVIGDSHLSAEQRIEKFKRLKLVVRGHSNLYFLSREGREIGSLIMRIRVALPLGAS